MKRKQTIQIAGNPLYPPKPKPNKTLDNPLTGTPVFGYFPKLDVGGRAFEEGEILLKYGQHYGPNRGFGLVHIWQEHFAIHETAEAALPDVAAFISSVLRPAATIHYEYGIGSSSDRTTVLRTTTGLVILEARSDGLNNCYYAVVTAFPGRKANGPVIGAIQKSVGSKVVAASP